MSRQGPSSWFPDTESSMTDIPLHPSLQRLAAAHRRLLRLLSLPIFLIVAGTLMFLMVTALSSRDLASLLLLAVIGLVMLPMMAALGGLLWVLDRWQAQRLQKANQILREQPPLAVRLTPAGSSRPESLVSVQRITSEPAALEPLYALLTPNPSLHWHRPPRPEIAVDLYCQTLLPGCALVVLQPDGSALLGRIVALDAYLRTRRLMMVAVVALLALVATALSIQAANR